jgi:hypothetical protein
MEETRDIVAESLHGRAVERHDADGQDFVHHDKSFALLVSTPGLATRHNWPF